MAVEDRRQFLGGGSAVWMADAPLVEYQDECILLVCTQKVKLVLSHLWARVELPATTGYALSKVNRDGNLLKEHDSFPAACWVSLTRLSLRLPILRRHGCAHRRVPHNDVLSSSGLNSDGSDSIRL